MLKTNRPKLFLLAFAFLFVVLSACGTASNTEAPPSSTPSTSAPPAPEQKPEAAALTPVNVGLLFFTADAGMFIAQEKGYFKEAGLDVKFERFKTGIDMMSVLATNKLDVGGDSVSPGLFNSFRQGMDIKIVGSKSNIKAPNFSSGGILVRKDLWDSGAIKDASDLKGKIVALIKIGGTSSSYVIRALEAKGLTRDDVKMVEVPANQMFAAFEKKAVDAAMVYSPMKDMIEKQGLGVLVPETTTADTADGDPTNVLFYSPEFAETDAAKRFVVAHTKGLRDYYKAIIEEKGDKEEIYRILGKYMETSPDTFRGVQMPSVDPDGGINIEAIKRYQDEWVLWKYQSEPANLESNIDTRFVEHAIKELGTYQ